MGMRSVALAAVVCLVTLSACSNGTSDQAETSRTASSTAPQAAAPAAAPAAVPVTYGRGFFNAEKDDTGQIWRWMGQEGMVLLPNTGRDSRLRLAAGAPVAKAVLRLELNGEALDEFVVEGGDFEKVYQVPAGRQDADASSELHIVMSTVLTAPHDPRRLGLRVFDIGWSAE